MNAQQLDLAIAAGALAFIVGLLVWAFLLR
jgi:hypothetical protein